MGSAAEGAVKAGRPERRWPNDGEYGLFHDGVSRCNRFADGSSVGGGRIVDALRAVGPVSPLGAVSPVCAVGPVGAVSPVGAVGAEWFSLARRPRARHGSS